MPDSKFFGIPFATSGDRATIPEAVQPGGAVSFTQGFGPDYERDPASDPLAKRVPRDETNEYIYQITNSLKFLQLYGTPEWYALDDEANPVSYPLSARVRHDAGAGMQAWRSIVATNTAEPGTDATKWVLDEAFSFTQLEATLAEALAGTLGTKVITPRRMASSVQRGAWNYAVAGGTANAITATISPAPAALSAGMGVRVKIGANNSGAVTLNLNALGAVAVVHKDGSALQPAELRSGQVADLVYDGANWQLDVSYGRLLSIQTFTASGTYTPTPGMAFCRVRMVGGGGGGAGGNVPAGGFVTLGSPGTAGAYAEGRFTSVQVGSSLAVTVGAAGTGGTNDAGATGGTTSFGALMTAPGGAPGGRLVNQSPPTVNGTGSVSASPSGGNILGYPGAASSASIALGVNTGAAGPGGSSVFGSGGPGIGSNANGANASGYGAGGSGVVVGSGVGVVTKGGDGSPGYMIIEEYSL